MPIFNVEKSIRIDAPIDKVFSTVRNFREWQPWSPWLLAEPGCTVNYPDDGMSYSWDGKIVGSGEMRILDENSPQTIEYQLTFLKPFKSTNSVRFHFIEDNGGTKATWTMAGSLPFFMFWMKSMMTAFVGMDFQRGLNMLKDYVETGSVPSQLEFKGTQAFQGFNYVGVRTECAIADVGPSMEKDLEKLACWLEQNGVQAAGNPFSIYHKWDMVRSTTGYTIGVPVTNPPGNLPADFITGSLPSCDAYVIRHTGPYRHLGNAWTSGMMHGRAKVFAQNKKVDPFEIYDSDPKKVAEKEVVTTLYFPVKQG